MELKGPPSPAPIPLAQVHKGGGRYRKSTPWENPPILLALVTYPLCSAQPNGGTSLKQVVPSSCQSMLLPTGGLWSLRKRASQSEGRGRLRLGQSLTARCLASCSPPLRVQAGLTGVCSRNGRVALGHY